MTKNTAAFVRDVVAYLRRQDLDAVQRLRDRYGAISMVGDGINEAPASSNSHASSLSVL